MRCEGRGGSKAYEWKGGEAMCEDCKRVWRACVGGVESTLLKGKRVVEVGRMSGRRVPRST